MLDADRHLVAGCTSLPGFTFLLPDGSVLAVSQRAGGAVTHPGDVELIPTKVLSLRPAGGGEEDEQEEGEHQVDALGGSFNPYFTRPTHISRCYIQGHATSVNNMLGLDG